MGGWAGDACRALLCCAACACHGRRCPCWRGQLSDGGSCLVQTCAPYSCHASYCSLTFLPCFPPPAAQVTDQQSGAAFSGASPTKPWTDVCIAHRTGQRISGPLFFGFSDPLTQRAIALNLYNEQELQAALQVGCCAVVCCELCACCAL